MPYFNTYAEIENLHRPTALNPGGYCTFLLFLHEDVEQWPVIDPATGIISDSVQLKTGKAFYVIRMGETDRFFKEEMQVGAGGPFHNITVNGKFVGNTNNATLLLGKYQHHQFGLLVKDRNGEQRLIGDKHTGARINFDYTSGDWNEQRGRNISFTWKNPQPAPIYHAGGISVIIPPVCQSYYLIAEFRVGAVGAPMVNGDTTFQDSDLANQNFICFADGVLVHQVTDTDTQRFCTKPYSSDTITFNGGVFGPPDTDPGEVISIYKVF
jgi:hypothetical protein